MSALIAVCSAQPRPSVQASTKPKGSQWWVRDVYHLRSDSSKAKTRCGRDCSEWIVIGPIDEPTDDCCRRCLSAKAKGGEA